MTIEDILLNGSVAEKRELWGFDCSMSDELILKKFKYYTIGAFPRYLPHPDSPKHEEMLLGYIRSYKGLRSFRNIASRGFAKTTKFKVFLSFVLLCDRENNKRYIKVGTKDSENSAQIVTDVYNLLVEMEPYYGDVFEKDGKTKREERMASFTMSNGVKVRASTVGKTQRGHVQDNQRPDWQVFDDVEDSESAESEVQTAKIIKNCDEAMQGLSVDGTWVLLGNYISDIGVVEYFRGLDADELITPLVNNDGEPNWDYFSRDKVEQLKKDALDWWGDYMCDPVTGANREFDKDMFRTVTWKEIERMNTRKFLTIDSAVTKASESDYWGFTINFVNTQNKWHFKSWRCKMDSAEGIDKMFELWQHFKLEAIGLEQTVFTQAIEPFLKEEMRKRNVFMNIIPLMHGGTNKHTRIRGLLPRYKNQDIYHIENECLDLEGELLRFPKSDNDDTMDSAAYQNQIAFPPEAEELEDQYEEDSSFSRF